MFFKQRFLTRKKTNPVSGIIKPKKLTWKRIARGVLILIGVGIVCAIALFAWFYKDLPKPSDFPNQNNEQSTILYDRNGKQIYDISGDQRRILLQSNEIPKTIKDATVSIEDPNFYHDPGVDFRGLARAIIFAGTRGGGSTLDQQYIKNAVLSPQRTIVRKIQEIILAIELDHAYSKDQILSLYLNQIPYGSNIYGVEAASEAYFGHSAKDGLSLSEAATLASIPQAPTLYSPYGSHVDLLIDRRNLVLDNMAKYGYITQAQADAAKKQAPLASKDFAKPVSNYPAPHFVEYVREQLVQKYGEDTVERGGLRVTTTLDLDLQQKAEQAVQEQAKTLTNAKATNAGLVSMDPKTGQILAMVGSVDYFDTANDGNFNVTTALRQPGSAGKPIVYATLFNQDKWSPSSILWDVQTDFNGYKPNDYDGKFRGPVTIRSALGNSLNIPAVKALQIEGIQNFLNAAKDFGITTLTKGPDQYGLSLALGGGEVKLTDLTSAYTVFANNGVKAPMTSILKIQDNTGKTLEEWKPSSKQIIKPEIAYEINNVLSDTNAKLPTFNGLIGVLSVAGKTTAVKTGTTDDFRDAWTIGYSPSLVTGVWVGNNDNTPMNHGGGSTAAAPVWHDFMVKALASKSNEQFYRPSSVSDVTVDLLSGKKPTPASGQLIKDIFAPWQVPTQDDDVHKSIQVCKSNGKLATDQTPSDQVETKVFTIVHSEHPDLSNWEQPVQAWAKSNNLSQDIPTDKCDITNQNPTISITSPADQAGVSGLFTVTTDVVLPPNTTGSVDFSVDSAVVATATADPYSATINTHNLTPGKHDITATVHASNNTSATTTISVIVNNDTTPPGDVSNVTILPGADKGTASATWTNPSDSDFESIIIYVSQSSGIKGAKLATLPANPGTTQNSSLTGLVSGTTNYITFVTVDSNGNQSQTTKQYTVIPL